MGFNLRIYLMYRSLGQTDDLYNLDVQISKILYSSLVIILEHGRGILGTYKPGTCIHPCDKQINIDVLLQDTKYFPIHKCTFNGLD